MSSDLLPMAVDSVACYRAAEKSQVHANLVGSACEGLHFKQGVIAVAFKSYGIL